VQGEPLLPSVPVVLHSRGCWPLQLCVPGMHDPPHAPGGVLTVPRHASAQVVVTHVPVVAPDVPHVLSCVSLMHSVVPGTQVPPHAPGAVPTVPMHASAQGVDASTHVPVALHVSVVVSL